MLCKKKGYKFSKGVKTSTLLIIIMSLVSFKSFTQESIIKTQEDIRNQVAKSAGSELTRLIKEMNLEDIFDQNKKINEKNGEIKTLKREVNSLETEINDLNRKLTKQKNENKIEIKKTEEETKERILDEFSEVFLNEDLQELMKNFNKIIIDRYRQLLNPTMQGKPQLNKRFNHLLTYFESKALLDEKFDSYNVNRAKKEIEEGMDNVGVELMDKLKKDLDNYEVRFDGYNTLIEKIKEIDEKTSVGVASIEEEKKKKIYYEISKYMKNYSLTYSNYPYISKNLFMIIREKERNADRSIEEILRN